MRFHLNKGARVKKGFIWIVPHADLWWSYQHKKWLPLNDRGSEGASTSFECKSVRAFRSHMRRHPELKGIKMELCHRCYGITPKGSRYSLNVEAVGRGDK